VSTVFPVSIPIRKEIKSADENAYATQSGDADGSDILVLLLFQSATYGPRVEEILSPDDAAGGARPMELFPQKCTNEAVRDELMKTDARNLFPGAPRPGIGDDGLFLYFSCLKEAHDLLHTFGSLDGAYWHGIMHRMEGDAYNADYWFRRTKLASDVSGAAARGRATGLRSIGRVGFVRV